MAQTTALISTSADGTAYVYHRRQAPTVVLIHGFGLNHSMWQWQVEALQPRYSVLVYDLIGHGDSAVPQQTPCLSLFSQQLLTLLDHLNIQDAIVAGFSLGGMICRRFAMDHPQRVWALAILHSAYKRTDAARAAIQSRVHQAQREGPSATVDAALERWFSDDYRQDHNDVMERIKQLILANDEFVYPTIYQVLVDGVDELVAPKVTISCPTLVMTGEQDFGNSVDMAHAIAAEIADARVVVLPALRHMAMMEAPELFNQHLLGFVDQVCENRSDG